VRSAHTAAGACWRGPVPQEWPPRARNRLGQAGSERQPPCMCGRFLPAGQTRREAARGAVGATSGTELRATARIAAGAPGLEPSSVIRPRCTFGVRLAARRGVNPRSDARRPSSPALSFETPACRPAAQCRVFIDSRESVDPAPPLQSRRGDPCCSATRLGSGGFAGMLERARATAE